MIARAPDVIVAGGGPAGAWAALLLARAGARVVVFERSRFPRPKLCGDTVNPGALAMLARHVPIGPLAAEALPIDGMILTGPGPVCVRGEYGAGTQGLAVRRATLDAWLIGHAAAAGAEVIEQAVVTAPVIDARGRVRGVRVRLPGGAETEVRAPFTVAADGRRSRLGSACGLSACASRPRRWAVGAYMDGVDGLSRFGEMHVRHGHYIGVAPTVDGQANVCLVQPWAGGEAWRQPDRLLRARIDADTLLGPRFTRARATSRAVVLGPLAVDARKPACEGLILVGDAAGFVDPMTGDGIRLALTSAAIAAATIGDVLEGRCPPDETSRRYARSLARALGPKRFFNRAMRTVVASPQVVTMAARAARFWPGALRAAICYAADIAPRSAA